MAETRPREGAAPEVLRPVRATLDRAVETPAGRAVRGPRPLAARIVLARLERIRRGHLRVVLPDGETVTFAGRDGGATPVLELEVHRWRFFTRLLRGGDVGAGEAFTDGDWSTNDLVGLTRLFLDKVVDRLDNFAADYAATLALWRRRFNAASREVLALGFDERFQRTWSFYLATCEAAFRHRQIGVLQLGLGRAAAAAEPRP